MKTKLILRALNLILVALFTDLRGQYKHEFENWRRDYGDFLKKDEWGPDF